MQRKNSILLEGSTLGSHCGCIAWRGGRTRSTANPQHTERFDGKKDMVPLAQGA